jgi:DNA-binding response OmpR family regulator
MDDMEDARGNVLVVEDDPDTAETWIWILAKAGYGVRKAPDRDAALKFMKTNLYSYVVLDLFMPGMSAEVFMQAMRKRPQIKVILITAASDAQHEAKRLKIANFLKKPVSEEQLLEALRTAK